MLYPLSYGRVRQRAAPDYGTGSGRCDRQAPGRSGHGCELTRHLLPQEPAPLADEARDKPHSRGICHETRALRERQRSAAARHNSHRGCGGDGNAKTDRRLLPDQDRRRPDRRSRHQGLPPRRTQADLVQRHLSGPARRCGSSRFGRSSRCNRCPRAAGARGQLALRVPPARPVRAARLDRRVRAVRAARPVPRASPDRRDHRETQGLPVRLAPPGRPEQQGPLVLPEPPAHRGRQEPRATLAAPHPSPTCSTRTELRSVPTSAPSKAMGRSVPDRSSRTPTDTCGR
jgi:hypothetical protein